MWVTVRLGTLGNSKQFRSASAMLAVYTLDEIARLLSAYPDISKAKLTCPGAEVTAIRKSISDPLDAIRDGVSLNDPLDDIARTAI